MTTSARERILGSIIVVAMAAAGVAIAVQGWRASAPYLDTIPSIAGAHLLLDEGRVPDRGVLNSYLSYVPPGATWLFVPGVVLFADPRLAEFPGAALLSIGTLCGVFVLTRRYFGFRAAVLAVVLYGLSPIGVRYAGSVGPRGHPFFYVWMVYFTCEWAARRDSREATRFLAAAIGLWAAGMYLFLELAPAALMFPAVWVVARPAVRWRPLAIVAVLAVIMWWPYLRFEYSRGFSDLASQFLLRPLPVESPIAGLQCDPGLQFERIRAGIVVPAEQHTETADTESVVIAAGRRVLAIGSGALANLETPIPGTNVILLALVLCGLFVLAPSRSLSRRRAGRGWLAAGLALLAAAAMASAPVVRLFLSSERTLTAYTRGSIRSLQLMLALLGLTLLARGPIVELFGRMRTAIRWSDRNPIPLVCCLAAPWLLCLLVVEHGRIDRFSFLWSVQVIVLAACAAAVARVVPRLPAIGLIVAIVAVVAGPAVRRAVSPPGPGWSGADTDEVLVTRDIVREVRASKQSEVSVGYRLFRPLTWGPQFALSDPRYKSGAEFDLLLRYPHGVANRNLCAEGIARQDRFRVYEKPPADRGPFDVVVVPTDPAFRLLRSYGFYDLYVQE